MIISISGTIGSGKSSIAKILSERLGWPRYYMGGIRREKAKELGMSLEEYNKLGETDSKTDEQLDDYVKNLGETNDNFIIESRTAWHFIPHSLKIFLSIDEERAAFLIFRDLQKGVERNESNNIHSEADMLQNIRDRINSDKIRYKKYYNIDAYDPANYDYTLDTTKLAIPEAAEIVYDYIKNKLPQ